MTPKKISKDEFEALPEILKEDFKAEGEDYIWQPQDVTALKSARDREKTSRLAAELKLEGIEAAKAKEIEEATAAATAAANSVRVSDSGSEQGQRTGAATAARP